MPITFVGPQAVGVGAVSAPPLVVYVVLAAPAQPIPMPGVGGFPGGVARHPVDQVVCEVGDRLVLSTVFQADNGLPTQPDHGPWFRIAGPDYNTVFVWSYGDPAIQGDGAGTFSLPWTPQLPGRYFWRVWATGQIERAHVGTIVVLSDPSNHNPIKAGPVSVGSIGLGGVGTVAP